jgi:hypothetical protein
VATLRVDINERVVDLVRFERTPSTFAESRSHSTELQVRSLAEGTGLEPASDIRAVVFGTTALPVRLPFHDWQGRSDLN